MLEFVLIVVVLTADLSHYKEFVEAFATQDECFAKKKEVLQAVSAQIDPTHVFYAACVRPKPLNSTDI